MKTQEGLRAIVMRCCDEIRRSQSNHADAHRGCHYNVTAWAQGHRATSMGKLRVAIVPFSESFKKKYAEKLNGNINFPGPFRVMVVPDTDNWGYARLAWP